MPLCSAGTTYTYIASFMSATCAVASQQTAGFKQMRAAERTPNMHHAHLLGCIETLLWRACTTLEWVIMGVFIPTRHPMRY